MRCRICGTASNLKYTSQQIEKSKKNIKNKAKRFPLSALPSTTGNICYECDDRLQNFHTLEDVDSDVDVDSDDNFFKKKKTPSQSPLRSGKDQRGFGMLCKNSLIPSGHTMCIQQTTNPKTASLGSDGDAEVIEVLTSRETTPEVNENNELKPSLMPINEVQVVDIIDLENYDDSGKEKPCFDYNKSACFVERETRLLGCLNLVSSDSESEINFEPCTVTKSGSKSTATCSVTATNGIVECSNNNINCKSTSVSIKHSFPVCEVCGVCFLDKPTLQTHMSEHEASKCPVCKQDFSVPLEFVYHMRQKHRSYDGDALCEGARCSQDSAMTIRLRVLQRYTYCECQLCGVIDSDFKIHKTHIMQKHADESKSLRDPMMKTQLKCPNCQQNCGTHQLDVCRHLLTKHNPGEYNEHLKEISNLDDIGLNVKNLQKIQHAARILALGTYKQRFFECQLCQKVLGSTGSFLKHLNGHNIDEWHQYKNRKATKTDDSVTIIDDKMTLKRKINTRNTFKSDTTQNNKTVLSTKKEPNEPTATKKPKLEYDIPNKIINMSKKSLQPKDTKIVGPEVTIKSKNFLPSSQSVAKHMKMKTTTEVNARQKKLTRKALKKDKTNKSAKNHSAKSPVKVKVKQPLRNFPTQKYNCKYCQSIFKGFRKLQLHLLKVHRSDEYQSCDSCTCTFATRAALNEHQCRWYGQTSIVHSKRKHNNIIKTTKNDFKSNNSGVVDENFNNNACKQRERQMSSGIESLQSNEQLSQEINAVWLQELLELSRKKEHELTYLNTASGKDLEEKTPKLEKSECVVCCYCAQLFKASKDVLAHEKEHLHLRDMPWIYFNPI